MEKQGSQGIPIWKLRHWEEPDLVVPIAVTLLKQHDVSEIREFNGKFGELTSALGPQARVLLELIHTGRTIGGSRFAAHGAGVGDKQPSVLCLFYRVAAKLQVRNSKYPRATSMGCHSWDLIYSVLLLPVMILMRHSTI